MGGMILAALGGALIVVLAAVVVILLGYIGAQRKMAVASLAELAASQKALADSQATLEETKKPFQVHFSEEQIYKLAHLIVSATRTLYESETNPN